MKPTKIKKEGGILQFYRENGEEHFYWIDTRVNRGDFSLDHWLNHLREKTWWTLGLEKQLIRLWPRQE